MFKNALSIENTKHLKRRLLWVELAIFILVISIAFSFIYLSFFSSPPRIAIPAAERANLAIMVTWPGSLVEMLHMVGGSSLGPLLVIIFVGAVTAQEYTWRTFHLLLSRGAPRSHLLAAKFTALLIPISAFVLTALIVGAAITAIFSFLIDGGLNTAQLDFLQLLLSVVRTGFTLLPYAGLTFFLAVASRSTVAAIGGGLAFSLVFETTLVQVLGLLGENMARLTQFFPTALANRLMLINQTAIGAESTVPVGALTPLEAALAILAWTVVFLSMSLLIFQRQDLHNS